MRKKNLTTAAATNMFKLPLLVIILVVTFISYSSCLKNGWLSNWDDDIYILKSPLVQNLSWQGIKNMFSNYETDNYHPLTTLSYAVEYKLYGFSAGKFHRDNLVLHLLNVSFVFWLLFLLTRRQDVAALVAVFFAIHPMHVESVAWVSERKDVLYSFFYLAALISYVLYVQRKNQKYLFFTLLLFLCSLLSKSAAVSFSLVLFLIDYFYKREPLRKTILEKIPFLALSLIFGLIAISSQGSSGAIRVSPDFSFLDRIFLSSYAFLFYIVKLFIPANLAALYLYPQKVNGFLPWIYYLCPFIILVLIILISRLKKFRKELIIGMLFYLFTILPVLQIIPVGRAITADRYSYIPYIGLLYIVAIFYNNLHTLQVRKAKQIKQLLTLLLIISSGAFASLTWQRNKVWENSLLLISDALEKHTGPYWWYKDYLYASRGVAKDFFQDYKGAISDYTQALVINPKYVDVLYNRGHDKQKLKDIEGALNDYAEVIKIKPDYVKAYYSLGTLKIDLKDYTGAISDFDAVLRINPDYIDAYNNRGAAYYLMDKKTEGCEDWKKGASLGSQNAMKNVDKYCR